FPKKIEPRYLGSYRDNVFLNGMSVIPGLLDFLGRHQVGGFQEAAKILLADVMEGSFAGGKALDGLVFHFQTLQVQDTQVFLAEFPDLVLLQLDFPGHAKGLREDRSPLTSNQERQWQVVIFCWQPVWRPRPAFSGWRHCWPWTVSVKTSSGWISGIGRP